MKVRFTPSARKQVLAAIAYIQRDKPGAASSFQKRANRSLQRLKKFPESGRRVPEFPEFSFREVIVAPYRFFYRVQGTIVWIAAVWHDAQVPDEPTSKA